MESGPMPNGAANRWGGGYRRTTGEGWHHCIIRRSSSKTDLDFSRAYDAKDAESFLSSELLVSSSSPHRSKMTATSMNIICYLKNWRPHQAAARTRSLVPNSGFLSKKYQNKDGLHISEAGQALKRGCGQHHEILSIPTNL